MDDRTSKAVDNEREEIENYVALHGLEPNLNGVVNEIVKERPEDPYADMSTLLLRKSERSELILGVSARELLTAQALPCLQVSITTIQGTFIATTGSGPYDGDSRYEGRGLKKSVDSVTHLIQDKLIGKELNQGQIDAFLSSDNSIPDNVALALSMACCRACAKHKGVELHAFIAFLANIPDPCIPIPCFSLVNGGKYAQSDMMLQELSVMFTACTSFEEALENGVKLQKCVSNDLRTKNKHLNIGLNGGIATSIEDVADVLKVVTDCATELGLGSCRLGLDVAAPSFASSGEGEDGGVMYNPSRSDKASELKSGEEMMDMYLDWLLRFNINTMDDLFAQGDAEVMMLFKERIDSELARSKERAAEVAAAKRKGRGGAAPEEFDDPVIPFEVVGNDPSCHLQIVGNDLVRSADDIDKFHEEQTVNTMVLTLSKGSTITGCIELAAKARGLGWGIVVGNDSKLEGGDTEDDFIAHLAIGIKAGQLRAGGLCGAENMAKYNTLLRIAMDETQFVPYAGGKFRNFQS